MQRMWPLLQNEWYKQAFDQAKEKTCKYLYWEIAIYYHFYFKPYKNYNFDIFPHFFRPPAEGKEQFVPIVKQLRQLYGEEITMENLSAMLVAFITNSMVQTGL